MTNSLSQSYGGRAVNTLGTAVFLTAVTAGIVGLVSLATSQSFLDIAQSQFMQGVGIGGGAIFILAAFRYILTKSCEERREETQAVDPIRRGHVSPFKRCNFYDKMTRVFLSGLALALVCGGVALAYQAGFFDNKVILEGALAGAMAIYLLAAIHYLRKKSAWEVWNSQQLSARCSTVSSTPPPTTEDLYAFPDEGEEEDGVGPSVTPMTNADARVAIHQAQQQANPQPMSGEEINWVLGEGESPESEDA